MIKISSITALGFLTLIVSSPFFGIFSEWKEIILMISGLMVIILSFLIRKQLHEVIKIIHGSSEVKSDTYVENNP